MLQEQPSISKLDFKKSIGLDVEYSTSRANEQYEPQTTRSKVSKFKEIVTMTTSFFSSNLKREETSNQNGSEPKSNEGDADKNFENNESKGGLVILIQRNLIKLFLKLHFQEGKILDVGI